MGGYAPQSVIEVDSVDGVQIDMGYHTTNPILRINIQPIGGNNEAVVTITTPDTPGPTWETDITREDCQKMGETLLNYAKDGFWEY